MHIVVDGHDIYIYTLHPLYPVLTMAHLYNVRESRNKSSQVIVD